jgi:GntR family transcriptional regulator
VSSLNSDNPVPRYILVAQLLRQRINKGVWKSGVHLPRLEDLMQEFSVSRVTARQGISLLAREGLVSVSRGRGTVVLNQKKPSHDRTLLLETSLADMANGYRNDQPSLTLIDECRAELPAVPADCGPPVPIYRYLKRVHSRDGEPYCLVSIYLDEELFNKAPDRFRNEIIIPALLDTPGIKIARAHQNLRISIADMETAQLLDLPLNSAVGEVVRFFHDTKGRLVYVAEITYRAEFINFKMELRV